MAPTLRPSVPTVHSSRERSPQGAPHRPRSKGRRPAGHDEQRVGAARALRRVRLNPAANVLLPDATIRGKGGGSRYFQGMARLCARPGCSAPAAAMSNFDGLNRIVWLNAFTDAAAYSAGDLCARHAERLRPPRNWELRDCRPSPAVRQPGATAPSRHYAPVPEPRRDRIRTVPSPVRVERPAASVPLVPHERETVRPQVASAKTPLLARAFRGAGGD